MESIKILRMKRNLKQTDIAEKLGITQGAVSYWESDGAFPPSRFLPKLASIFDCTIDELFKDEEDFGS
ncbi:MAG: helix-turn-helix transcriptional regulator [Clostridiaceae bacterium]|jgi:transcriptional regulator with XRE-family HTH domain|nr:helix-turn-helix transcriptional regulator [Butyricicoccus pullicaecorum]MBS7225291.1 helix-turn-helix transcriptional regulator [Clostridiaceae bacterium]